MQRKPFLILALAVIAILLLPARHSAQQPPLPAPPQSTPPLASTPDGAQAPPAGQNPTVIQSRVTLVDILFTVLNRRNKLVPDLEKADFKIFDDKAPQEIRYFSKQTDLPLRIGMLLDTSNTILVQTLYDEPQIIQKFTGDAGALRDEIFKTRAGGGTAIYDAIYSACLNELSHPPRPPGDQPDVVRRVMILISDGDDNLSAHTRADAIEMAQRASVVIYTISTSTQWIALSQTDPSKAANRKNHLTPGDQILQDLAEENRGRAFFSLPVDDLDQSFQDIGDELRNEYSIAYSPTNYIMDGRYHKIRIETPNHKGYQVNARRGYFARAGANSAGAGTPPAGSPR